MVGYLINDKTDQTVEQYYTVEDIHAAIAAIKPGHRIEVLMYADVTEVVAKA